MSEHRDFGIKKFSKERELVSVGQLSHYRETGHFDLSRVSPKELKEIKELYQRSFDSLDESAKVELLEQLLLHDAVDQDWVMEFMPKLTEEQRQDLGSFVGKVMPSEKIFKIFHNCFGFFSRKDQDFFIRYFTREQPEAGIMVAPFCDLKKVEFRKMPTGLEYVAPETSLGWHRPTYKPRELRKQSSRENVRNLMDLFFRNYNSARQLMDAILAETWPKDYDGRRPQGAEGLIDYYAAKEPTFLLPYLPRLLQRGLIKQDKIDEMVELFCNKEKPWRCPILFAEFHRTAAEAKQEQAICQQLKKKNPAFDEGVLVGNALRFESDIQKGLELSQLRDSVKKRALGYLLQNWSETRQLFPKGKDLDFLLVLLDKGLPVFYALPQLNLSADEIDYLVKEASKNAIYLTSLFDFSDVEQLIKAGHESDFVRQSFNPDYYLLTTDAKNLVLHAQKIMPQFSAAARQAIIESINKNEPDIWLLNLDYAIDNQVMPLPNLLKSIMRDRFVFLRNYQAIVAMLKRFGEEKFELDVNDVRKKAEKIFRADPGLVFSNKMLAMSVFTPEKYQRFIEGQLRAEVSPDFVKGLILSSESERYKRQVIALIKKRPRLAGAAAITWSELGRIFSPEERVRFLLTNLLAVGAEKWLGNSEFIKTIAQDENYSAELADCLKHVARTTPLVGIIDMVSGLMAEPYQQMKSSRLKKNCDVLKKAGQASLARLVAEDPLLVFNDEMMSSPAVSEYFSRLIETHVASYAQYHPEILLRYDLYKRLPRQEFSALFQRHCRALAFSDKCRHAKWLTPPEREALARVNPLIIQKLEKNVLEIDYYETAIALIRDKSFYPQCQNQLEKIAKEELNQNGPRLDIQYWDPRDDFYHLVRRVCLLSCSDSALKNREAIEKLPNKSSADKAAKENLLRLLEFAIVHNEDNNLDLDIERDGAQKTIEALFKKFIRYLSAIMDMPELTTLQVAEIDLNTIDSLLVYYEHLEEEDDDARQTLRGLLQRVLNGKYYAWRIWGTDAVPEGLARQTAFKKLQRQKLLPENLRLEQYEKWTQEDSLSLEAVLDLDIGDVRQGIKNIFSQAVADHHIRAEDLQVDYNAAKEALDKLVQPMAKWTKRIKELKQKGNNIDKAEEAELEELRQTIDEYQRNFLEDIEQSKAMLYLARLIALTPQELEAKILVLDRVRVRFEDAFKILERVFCPKYPDFMQDLQRLRNVLQEGFQNIFGKSRVSKAKLIVTDRVDFKTHLRIGEEPVPSCQSYKSSGHYSVGLLSYLADPSVKIIQVWGENDKIIARAALRLLEDEERKPQLFLERIYSVNNHHKIREAIAGFAKKKAEAIGCHLYTHSREIEKDSAIPGTIAEETELISRNSRSPYVYTDAGGGKMPRGKYAIQTDFMIA